MTEAALEYEFDGYEYRIGKLSTEDSLECLLRLGKLGVLDGTETGMSTIVNNLTMKDIRFFSEKLLGQHLQFQNETGQWVPLVKTVADAHFEGRPAAFLHMLVAALKHNFADFLADLHLERLVGESAAA